MRLLFLSFFAATLIFGFMAQAETAMYSGIFQGRALSLTLETKLPAELIVTKSNAIYDPKFDQVVPASSTETTAVGTATLSAGGDSKQGVLFAAASDHVNGAAVTFSSVIPTLSTLSLIHLNCFGTAGFVQLTTLHLPGTLSIIGISETGSDRIDFQRVK